MLLYLLWFFVLFSRAKLEPAKNCKTVWLLLRHSFIWVYMCIVLVASLAYVTALWKQENFRPFLISSFQYLSQTSFRTVRSQNTFIHTFTFRHSHVNKTKQTHTYIHTWFRNRKYLYKHYRLSDTKQKNKQQNGVLGGQEAPPARIKV